MCIHTKISPGCLCSQKVYIVGCCCTYNSLIWLHLHTKISPFCIYAYGSHLIACTHRNLTRIVLLCLREHVCFFVFFFDEHCIHNNNTKKRYLMHECSVQWNYLKGTNPLNTYFVLRKRLK